MVAVGVGDEYAVEAWRPVLSLCLPEHLLCVEPLYLWEEVELEEVLEPRYAPWCEVPGVVVLARVETLTEVEPDAGVTVLEEYLVPAYLSHAAVEPEPDHHGDSPLRLFRR